VGGRVTAAVTDGVSINLDGSWFNDGSTGAETARVQAEASAAVTETITLTAAVGAYFGSGVVTPDGNIIYGRAGIGYAPGGNLTAGANIEVNDEGGWRTEFNASKTF